MKSKNSLVDVNLIVDDNNALYMNVALKCRLVNPGTSEFLRALRTSNLWAVHLFQLSEEERYLNSGRFRAFQKHPLEYEVEISNKKLSPSRESYGWANDVICWIASHNQGTSWSMQGEVYDVSHFNLVFSFQDDAEAAHFALRWR
jgi:hypothetical protein